VSLPLAQLPGCVPHITNFVPVRVVAIIAVINTERNRLSVVAKFIITKYMTLQIERHGFEVAISNISVTKYYY